MRHKLLTATLAPGGQADEPVPEKQVAARPPNSSAQFRQ